MVGLEVGGNCVWYFVIVVIFMGLEGTNSCEEEGEGVKSYGGQATKMGVIWERVDPSRHHDLGLVS